MTCSFSNLPGDILRVVKGSLPTLASHVAFSQLCRAARGCYNLNDSDDNDFVLILRAIGIGRPNADAMMLGFRPTWTELAVQVAAHAARCKCFKYCREVAGLDPSLRSAHTTVLTSASDTEAKAAVRACAAAEDLTEETWDASIDGFLCYPEGGIAYRGGEGISSHPAFYCRFATTRPVDRVVISLKYHRLQPLVNANGVTLLDLAEWLHHPIRSIHSDFQILEVWVAYSPKALLSTIVEAGGRELPLGWPFVDTDGFVVHLVTGSLLDD